MARIVLDTNCLIQCLPEHSKYHIIWQTFEKGENKLCISNSILEEYMEIMQRLINDDVAEYIIKTIINSPFVEFITPFYNFRLITSDPDDNKFVDCAIAARAKCIVTNDHHFDVVKKSVFPKVNIESLQEFYDEIIGTNTLN